MLYLILWLLFRKYYNCFLGGVEVSFDLAKSYIKTSSCHHPTKTRRIKWMRQILNYLLFPTYNEVIYWQEGL